MKKPPDELRRKQRIVPHAEEMGLAGAVRRAETIDTPIGYFIQRRRNLTLQVCARPYGKGGMKPGKLPQIIDVPEEVLSFAPVPVDPPGQVLFRRACIEVKAFPEPDVAEPADRYPSVPWKPEHDDVASAVTGLLRDQIPGYCEFPHFVSDGEIVVPSHR